MCSFIIMLPNRSKHSCFHIPHGQWFWLPTWLNLWRSNNKTPFCICSGRGTVFLFRKILVNVRWALLYIYISIIKFPLSLPPWVCWFQNNADLWHIITLGCSVPLGTVSPGDAIFVYIRTMSAKSWNLNCWVATVCQLPSLSTWIQRGLPGTAEI